MRLRQKLSGNHVRNVIPRGMTRIRGSVNTAMERAGGRAENVGVKVSLRIVRWESLLMIFPSVLNVTEANGLLVDCVTEQQQTWVMVKYGRVMACAGAAMEQAIYNSDLRV
jgi:hypothetical protein